MSLELAVPREEVAAKGLLASAIRRICECVPGECAAIVRDWQARIAWHVHRLDGSRGQCQDPASQSEWDSLASELVAQLANELLGRPAQYPPPGGRDACTADLRGEFERLRETCLACRRRLDACKLRAAGLRFAVVTALEAVTTLVVTFLIVDLNPLFFESNYVYAAQPLLQGAVAYATESLYDRALGVRGPQYNGVSAIVSIATDLASRAGAVRPFGVNLTGLSVVDQRREIMRMRQPVLTAVRKITQVALHAASALGQCVRGRLSAAPAPGADEAPEPEPARASAPKRRIAGDAAELEPASKRTRSAQQEHMIAARLRKYSASRTES